jgi:hypothetical protein
LPDHVDLRHRHYRYRHRDLTVNHRRTEGATIFAVKAVKLDSMEAIPLLDNDRRGLR